MDYDDGFRAERRLGSLANTGSTCGVFYRAGTRLSVVGDWGREHGSAC